MYGPTHTMLSAILHYFVLTDRLIETKIMPQILTRLVTNPLKGERGAIQQYRWCGDYFNHDTGTARNCVRLLRARSGTGIKIQLHRLTSCSALRGRVIVAKTGTTRGENKSTLESRLKLSTGETLSPAVEARLFFRPWWS